MRGDGPICGGATVVPVPAPPHARGWTLLDLEMEAASLGSPACAGMDLTYSPPALYRCWLPRMRGDGPTLSALHGREVPAPPHARGWTPHRSQPSAGQPGSPACAGMDPTALPAACRSRRLPRMRGDGPHRARHRTVRGRAPPHARGWTRRNARATRYDTGSPACAGMDPQCKESTQQQTRLPRMRGDGPQMQTIAGGASTAPPHARGWTLVEALAALDRLGSPACAGMDPRGRTRRMPRSRLPRMRGDGPSVPQRPPPSREAPPHARGWTRLLARRSEVRRGSPACAGMDP